jgi:hypothetical protein
MEAVKVGGERGTYEIEIEDLVIPATRYPNDFSFLYISSRTFHNSRPQENIRWLL